MPKRNDISSICVFGSGPVVIGQAAEFDYSGTQALKALKEDGYRVVLVNSNPATIMTDPGFADATYIEPMTVDCVTEILRHERPDALLPTVGGQTGLNLALGLEKAGVLDELGIELIGAEAEVIERAENRELFKTAMSEIGLDSLRSVTVHTLDEAVMSLDNLGLPVVIRPSFTMGGSGGGIAYTQEEFKSIVSKGLSLSPTNEVLLEESALGWKEYEYEVMRDKNDNAVIVCTIENLDPMGVHTGDSITVAPAQTLTDTEYQNLRDASLAILRKIGVKTGGSNVQFGVHPQTGRVVVIEMNPRVSRSSALASKATGYPIAKIAAKVAVGYTLDEITNDITLKTKAAHEPAIDYVVIKAPRFAFEKFQKVESLLHTQMQSVGEAMAFGRNFKEALGKVLGSLEYGFCGLDPRMIYKINDKQNLLENLDKALQKPFAERLLLLAESLRQGVDRRTAGEATAIDPWFIAQVEQIIALEKKVANLPLSSLTEEDFWKLKQAGFSDIRIGDLTRSQSLDVRQKRVALGVKPCFKRVDTCAGEFEAHTSYMYSTYEKPFTNLNTGLKKIDCESKPSPKRKIIVLGSGPIRIGQGIEFDYCCVHAVMALRDAGVEAIMINCNPETVSTDYDTSDRLYFEPLTLEHVLNVVEKEQPEGVIVQFGGQTPLNLAKGLQACGVTILGTSPDAIDCAEDRERSAALNKELNLLQPESKIVCNVNEAIEATEVLGFPVMLRPSYVLGGRAMEIVYDEVSLADYMKRALVTFGEKPVLIDHFLDGAIEVDVDVICDGNEAIVGGIMQQIQEAGVHSGDSTCVLPPHDLSEKLIVEMKDAAVALAKKLKVVGLMNVQMAVYKDEVYILEVNPRASRTVPFVSKAVSLPMAKIATQLILGKTLSELKIKQPPLQKTEMGHVAIKEPVFPFVKFPQSDTLLGPEMRSTGEVMGIDSNFERAYVKSQLAAGVKLPVGGTLLVSIAEIDKLQTFEAIQMMHTSGFKIVATPGSANFLNKRGIACESIVKAGRGKPDIIDIMLEGKVQLMFNTANKAHAISDSFLFRRKALDLGIPYYTTVATIKAACLVIKHLQAETKPSYRSIQSYHENLKHAQSNP